MVHNPDILSGNLEQSDPPKQTFKTRVVNGEVVMAGPGFVPHDIRGFLDGLEVEVAKVQTFDGLPTWVVIETKAIADAYFKNDQISDGEWWDGFSHAFMSPPGQPSATGQDGRILIHVQNGELKEVAGNNEPDSEEVAPAD